MTRHTWNGVVSRPTSHGRTHTHIQPRSPRATPRVGRDLFARPAARPRRARDVAGQPRDGGRPLAAHARHVGVRAQVHERRAEHALDRADAPRRALRARAPRRAARAARDQGPLDGVLPLAAGARKQERSGSIEHRDRTQRTSAARRCQDASVFRFVVRTRECCASLSRRESVTLRCPHARVLRFVVKTRECYASLSARESVMLRCRCSYRLSARGTRICDFIATPRSVRERIGPGSKRSPVRRRDATS